MPDIEAAASEATAGGVGAVGRVGPNAILQTAAALRAFGGPGLESTVLTAAGLGTYLDRPPADMIDQAEAVRLFRAVLAHLPSPDAERVLADAGGRTGDYILAHRIPSTAQTVLLHLPKSLAARFLLSAIGTHAWTFAGSGVVTCGYGAPLRLTIASNPLATPGCPWHVAVFERLFHALVSDRVTVRHIACCTKGAVACRFELTVP